MRGKDLLTYFRFLRESSDAKFVRKKMLHVFLQPVAVDLSYSVNLALRLLNVFYKREIRRREEEGTRIEDELENYT
jgi:hypothetical protein